MPVPFYDRWILPLIPILAYFASSFIVFFLKYLKSGGFIEIFAKYLFLIFLVSAPLVKGLGNSLQFQGIDTRVEEVNWLEANNIEERDVIRDKFTGKDLQGENELITSSKINNLNNYKYFIASSYFYSYLIQQNENKQKTIKYESVINSYQTVKNFKSIKMPLYRDDMEFLLTFTDWKFKQKRGPNINIYNLQERKT